MCSFLKRASLSNFTVNPPKKIGYHKYPSYQLTTRSIHFQDKPEDFNVYFATLEISKDSDQEQVRQAFLKLVKRFHPDSGSSEANVERFNKIETAYRKIQNKFAHDRWNAGECAGEYGLYYEQKKKDEAVQEFDIKHTAPQHRQYLSYGGYGVGTPAQRQKQFQKKRAVTAVENVQKHRIDKLTQSHEEALVIKDKAAAQKIKTRFEVDRLVEDLIQESMSRGEFDNLAGSGKPLSFNHHSNPYVDFVTHKMNQVLIDNGFTPEWITLQKEIREEVREFRVALTEARTRLGPLPLTAEEEYDWRKELAYREEAIQRLNKKINQFNLIVPLLVKQMVLIQLNKEGEKVLAEGKNKLQVPQKEINHTANKEKYENQQRERETGLFGLLESLLFKQSR